MGSAVSTTSYIFFFSFFFSFDSLRATLLHDLLSKKISVLISADDWFELHDFSITNLIPMWSFDTSLKIETSVFWNNYERNRIESNWRIIDNSVNFESMIWIIIYRRWYVSIFHDCLNIFAISFSIQAIHARTIFIIHFATHRSGKKIVKKN